MKKILFLIVALSATLNMSANAPAVSVGAAKPVVLVDVPTARDWFDKLEQAIATVTLYVNSEMSEEDPVGKASLKEELKDALAVHQGVFDDTKGVEYENAYNSLWDAYQEVLRGLIESKIDELVQAIADAKSLISNGEIVDYSLKNELEVGKNGINFIDVTRQKFYDTETSTYVLRGKYESSHYGEVKTAISDFNDKVDAIKEEDRSNAWNALNSFIGEVEARRDVIVVNSTVIAGIITNAIEGDGGAKSVLNADPVSTAKQLAEAKSTLSGVLETQNSAYNAFLTAKNNLRTAYRNAQIALSGIGSNHEAIYNTLSAAITTAQGHYGNIDIETSELDNAKNVIESAKTAAESAEVEADKIDVLIDIAEDAVKSLSGDAKTAVEEAIVEAKEAVKTLATADELSAAFDTFNFVLSTYVDSALSDAKTELDDKIEEAKGKYEGESQVIAYDEFKYALAEAVREAMAVSGDATSTLSELKSATTALNDAITENVNLDKDKASSDYDKANSDAWDKFNEVDKINTPIATTLQQKIGQAQPTDQKAITLKASADALRTAMEEADNAVTEFNTAVGELEGAIETADEYGKGIDKEIYKGIYDALSEKIGIANGVSENTKDVETSVIEQATTNMNNAYAEAESAMVYATQLHALIKTAEEDVYPGILDPDNKAGLLSAIEEAKNLFGDKEKISLDYEQGCILLESAIRQYVTGDINIAKADLAIEINSAKKYRDQDAAYTENEHTLKLTPAIETANGKKSEVDATAQSLVAAKDDLHTAVEDYVAEDLVMARAALENAIGVAESALTPYAALIEKIDDAASQDTYEQNVVKPFQDMIDDATALSSDVAKDVKSTATALISGIDNTLKTNYNAQWNIEKQSFMSAYIAESSRADYVGGQNKVIVPAHNTEIGKAAGVMSILNAPEVPSIEEYSVDKVINVRVGMQKELEDLDEEFNTWYNMSIELKRLALNQKQGVLDGLTQVPEDIKTTLEGEYAVAEAVYHSCRQKRAEEIVAAYNKLREAIEYAKGINDNCNFTDAEPVLKNGEYKAEHVKYTRTGDAITSGNYGTFCMPMDIVVDEQFSDVYLPEPFAILSATEEAGKTKRTLKLFLTKVEDETVIPAGTPFFAHLDCEAELNLISNNVLKVVAGEPYYPVEGDDPDTKIEVITTSIQVYNQSANSSFLTKSDLTYTWSGTFEKLIKNDEIDQTTGKYVAETDGSFKKAGSSISPFRAFVQENTPSNAKSVDAIEFDFGDGSETTGIRSILMGSSDGSQIFSIDGKNMGNDMNSLNKGVYIINGKKVLK